jgi:hypothetical protein
MVKDAPQRTFKYLHFHFTHKYIQSKSILLAVKLAVALLVKKSPALIGTPSKY